LVMIFKIYIEIEKVKIDISYQNQNNFN